MRYTQPEMNHGQKWVALGLWLWLTAACVGCGGRSESEPDSGESTDSDATNGNDNGGDGGDDEGTGDDMGSTGDLPLGDCVEGWPVYEAECPWLGSNDLCYATKEDACACLCPRDANSTCVSGLPGGPNDEVAVSCF